MHHEKDFHERQMLILREELLQKAKDTIDVFLLDTDEKSKSTEKGGHLYNNCKVLIRKTVETKLEDLMKTIDAMRSEMAAAYEILETKCCPIMDQNIPIPAAIQQKSMELLRKETTTVFKYERQIRRAVMHMLADENMNLFFNDSDTDDDDDDGDYGIDFRLDFERDTIEEVTNIVNLYPEAFDDANPPRVIQRKYPRLVAFVPCILSLWIKHCNHKLVKGDGYDAWGLVYHKVINPLLPTFSYSCYDIITMICEHRYKNPVEDKHRFFDKQYAQVIQWFINEGFVVVSDTFMEDDTNINSLIKNNYTSPVGSFIEHRFQVLVNLCPAALELPHSRNPLYTAAVYSRYQYECFILVFMTGIKMLKKNKGILLLFQQLVVPNGGCSPVTPFSLFVADQLCYYYKKKDEEKKNRLDAIDKALNDPTFYRNHPPYDTAQALIEAATSGLISLDGVFFFLRREPDVLQKLLLHSTNDTNTIDSTKKNTNQTTKRNSALEPRTSTDAGLISTKKAKTR